MAWGVASCLPVQRAGHAAKLWLTGCCGSVWVGTPRLLALLSLLALLALLALFAVLDVELLFESSLPWVLLAPVC